jgi:hypothetical protein
MHLRRSTGLFVLSLIAAFFLSACGGGGGGSAPDLSPSATTLPANSVTNDGAILNATVNPKGLSTNAWFEYSTDPTLATNLITTAPQALGSGSTDIAITQTLTGLDSGQTYHFRVTATSSAGTKKGAIFSISTLPLPTVTTNPASSITTTGATLNAIVNPNGRQTSAWFEYGTTSSLGTVIDNQLRGSGTDNVAISTNLTGLNVATQYFYRIVANSSAGTSNGTILNFTTAGGVPLVTTKSAISVTTTSGVLRADVNPSGLATTAWFEYGTDNTFGTFATTDNQAVAAGTNAVEITAPITGRSLGETIYYRVAASNIVGPSLKGEAFSFTTLNPPPTANAGPDQAVYMAGPNGDLGFLGETIVALAGSGSTDPGKTITSFLWEQIAGTAVTLDNPASPTPTFPAPALAFGTNQDLQFKLTVTDNSGLTGTDNVLVNVKWGFLDDFSTDSTGTYNTFQTLGTTATFIHDAAGQRGRVQTGSGEGIIFQKEFKIVLPGPDTQLYTNTGVFSLIFYPSSQSGSGGNISIRLAESGTTYYEFSTQDDILRKVRAGIVVDSAPFTNSYLQNSAPNPIRITFSPTLTTVEAFGGTASLTTNENSNSAIYFEVRADQQNGYFDNITLEAAP